MSIATETERAVESLSLRRDNAGLRQALQAREHEAGAMRLRIERLERIIKLLQSTDAVHRLRMDKVFQEI